MQESLDQQAKNELKRAYLGKMQDILARMLKNVNLVNSVPNAQIANVISTNLFKVATQYYGDPDYWTIIAEANNLSDPEINGAMTLLIPPKPSSDPGGILSD